MNPTVLLIIGGVIVAACFLCAGIAVLGGGLSLGLTQPAATAGDEFMTALEDGDCDNAYSLCTLALQQEFGSARSLEAKIKNGKAQPTQRTFTSRKVNGDSAELCGEATFTGNVRGTVRLDLDQANCNWKISAFDLISR